MVFFTQLIKRPVVDKDGTRLGELVDLAFKDGEKLAEVTHIIVCEEGQFKKISWEYMKELIDRVSTKRMDVEIFLTKKSDEIKREKIEDPELLVSTLLDRQIVDITGLKIVRVNDVVLGKVGAKLCICGVDVGSGSILRRLGLDFFGKFSSSKSFLPWEYVEPIDKEIHSLRVSVDRSKLSKLHPADIADIMEDLNPKQRILMFNELDDHTAAKTLVETEPEVSKEMMDKVKTEKILALMQKLDADEVMELLDLIPKEKAEVIIPKLDVNVRRMLANLLEHPEYSAGRIMNPDVISVNENWSVHQVIEKLRTIAPKSSDIYYIYVVDENQKLVGVLSLRDIIIQQPGVLVAAISNRDVIKVGINTHKDEVAKIIIKYSLSALPVVDKEGILKGKITMNDVLEDTAHKAFRTKPKYAAIVRQHYPERHKNGTKDKRSLAKAKRK